MWPPICLGLLKFLDIVVPSPEDAGKSWGQPGPDGMAVTAASTAERRTGLNSSPASHQRGGQHGEITAGCCPMLPKAGFGLKLSGANWCSHGGKQSKDQ